MLPSIMVVTLKSLILSEKSLQVELDYSVIINHIQKHENKFCLHICDHLKGEKRGWGCELGELCICITFSQNKRAENDLFRAAETSGAPFIFHSNYIQSILFYLLFFSVAQSLIWQVMLILEINSCQQIPAVIPCAVWLAECKRFLTKDRENVSALSNMQQDAVFVLQLAHLLSWVKHTDPCVLLE